MSTNPCQICGCTDLNLVDGFYYCVECGTQDVNVRETIVEQAQLADGTYAIVDTKKFSTVLQDSVQMSGEWHKWHAYNFILAGLTEELLGLGAKPTVKMKVLWIWVRYIKRYQQKEQPEATQFEDKTINDKDEEDKDDDIENFQRGNLEDGTFDGSDESECEGVEKQRKLKIKEPKYKINNISKGVMLTILYTALNLDESDIQLSHLFRFIREGHLSIYNCTKFVPKELSVKTIPNWSNFNYMSKEYTTRSIRAYAMTMFKELNLGVPLVPNLNKIIHNNIQELCLPNDFRDLVLSLIDLMPCDFLQVNDISKKWFSSTPEYETVCMSYILIGFKMCFGLDCDYEIRISDAVDKFNLEEDVLKSYKLGIYSEPTDRIFSFREWYMFIQLRKIILCKYYLPMARKYNFEPDDTVFMEHLEQRRKRKMKLSDDITMDILNKIPFKESTVIPKKEFPVTFTPMVSYTEVILEHISDPDLKLRLCEDFSQYSLKYATTDLKFPRYMDSDYIFTGVDKSNKTINSFIIGTLTPKTGDPSMVFVRNCDNKNWLKTKPPGVKHVTIVRSDTSTHEHDSRSKFSDCDEGTDDALTDDEAPIISEEVCDVFEEEDEGLCIFDDDFTNLYTEGDDNKSNVCQIDEVDNFEFHNEFLGDNKSDVNGSLSASVPELVFNPDTFDKKKTIKDLIEIACKKYKIPRPRENTGTRPRKRKNIDHTEAGVSEPKKKKIRLKPGELVEMTQGLIDAYYETINNDVMLKLSEHVKSFIENTDKNPENQELNITASELNDQVEGIDNDNIMDNTDTLTRIDNVQNSSTNENNDINIADNGTIVDDDDNDEGKKDIEELLPKSNPNFDPNTHDIKQLYVNFKEDLNLQNLLNPDLNDSEIDTLIDKKIAQFEDTYQNNDRLLPNIDHTSNDKNIESDSSDEIPLSAILEEKLYYKRKVDKLNLENLIKDNKIKKFKYWMKHYRSKVFCASNTMTQKFNIELAENCPKSFVFVLSECAEIIECSAFDLYKCLQKLEEKLASHIEIKKKRKLD